VATCDNPRTAARTAVLLDRPNSLDRCRMAQVHGHRLGKTVAHRPVCRALVSALIRTIANLRPWLLLRKCNLLCNPKCIRWACLGAATTSILPINLITCTNIGILPLQCLCRLLIPNINLNPGNTCLHTERCQCRRGILLHHSKILLRRPYHMLFLLPSTPPIRLPSFLTLQILWVD
jgi:hypothetical protein